MNKFLLGTFSFALLAASQIAMAVPQVSWTGFYVGVNGGRGWINSDVSFNIDKRTTGLFFPILIAKDPASLASDPKGSLFGLQVGINQRVMNGVFGVEVDYDWARISKSQSADGGLATIFPISMRFPETPYTYSAKQRQRSLGTLRVRAGVLAFEPLLLYITAGVAAGQTQISGSISGPALPPLPLPRPLPLPLNLNGSHSSSESQAGWVIGGGIEFAFACNWSVKGEYLYYNLGSRHNVLRTFPGVTQEVHFKGDVLRLGLNYNFA